MTWDPGVSATLGSLAYIGTTLTDGTADVYTEIKHLQNITVFGRVYQIVKFVPIATGFTEKFKGEVDDGDIKLSVGYDLGDAGQAAVNTAVDDTSVNYYNMKLVLNDASAGSPATPTSGSAGTTFYFKVKFTSFTVTPGTVSSVVMGEITAAVKTGGTTRVAAT